MSTRPEFNAVQLGNYGTILHTYLKNFIELGALDYKTSIFDVFIFKQEIKEDGYKYCINPHNKIFQKWKAYKFICYGYEFIIKVDEVQVEESMDEYIFNKNTGKIIGSEIRKKIADNKNYILKNPKNSQFIHKIIKYQKMCNNVKLTIKLHLI